MLAMAEAKLIMEGIYGEAINQELLKRNATDRGSEALK